MGSIFIEGDTKKVWEALTKEEQITKWYAPGATLSIPTLDEGEKVTLTYVDDEGEQQTEIMTIEALTPFQEISFSRDGQLQKITFSIKEDAFGTTVTVNLGSYDESLANLKTFIEGGSLPYK